MVTSSKPGHGACSSFPSGIRGIFGSTGRYAVSNDRLCCPAAKHGHRLGRRRGLTFDSVTSPVSAIMRWVVAQWKRNTRSSTIPTLPVCARRLVTASPGDSVTSSQGASRDESGKWLRWALQHVSAARSGMPDVSGMDAATPRGVPARMAEFFKVDESIGC
jgi:hypothetical protein